MEIELSPDLRMQYAAAFQYADAVIKKIGKSKFFLDGKYKRYKELFVGAVIAQMLSEDMETYHFVAIDSDPPDFTLRVRQKHTDDVNKTDEISYAFELTDYTEHDSSIEAVIDKKLKNNKLQGQSLAVLFKHPTETTYDIEEFKKKYNSVKEWILIVMRVDRTNSGILLPEERWLVASVTEPYIQKLIKPDKIYKRGLDQMWIQKHRGKDKTFSTKPLKIRLPD